MKFPKHRANCYMVERALVHPRNVNYTVIGVFPTLDGATAFRDACEQEFIDKKYPEDSYAFSVILSTYYDA